MENNYNLDLNRLERLGFPEVVYGENKDIHNLASIAAKLVEKHGCAYITRLKPDKIAVLKDNFPEVDYDPKSGACIIGACPQKNSDCRVAIISAGTSDEFIVNEVFYTLKFLGIKSKKFQDLGVAGLHRILNAREELQAYDVLVVIAGFEGALPTVVGSLMSQPIIAVPSSIGYGVAKGGRSALESMLSSCANGIMVMNIDNGYGAALAAFRIVQTITKKIQRAISVQKKENISE